MWKLGYGFKGGAKIRTTECWFQYVMYIEYILFHVVMFVSGLCTIIFLVLVTLSIVCCITTTRMYYRSEMIEPPRLFAHVSGSDGFCRTLK